MTKRDRFNLASIAFSTCLMLIGIGEGVCAHGEFTWLVGVEQTLVNHATTLALLLTWSCYPTVLGPIGLALLIASWRLPEWRGRILFSIAMLLLCWLAADQLQHFFHRPRRLDWVLHHETSFSYPSSHAAIALGFYGLWAVMLAQSTLGVRRWLVPVLWLLVAGIYWSRLALGAHYVTDLVGGALLAIALVSAGVAVAPIKVIGFPAPRS